MTNLDVKEIRARLNLTQEQFAEQFGINVTTLRQWEQGRRMPSNEARLFLAVIARAPEIARQTRK